MKKVSSKTIKYWKKRARRELQKKVKHNQLKKRNNRRFNKVKRNQRKWIRELEHTKSFIAPKIFVLRENADEVINYMEKLKAYKNSKTPAYVNLSKVEKITNGAIAMLLAVVKELGKNHVKVLGNKPKSKDARKTLDASGFLRHVNGMADDEDIKGINTIVTRGHNNVEAESTAPLIQSAMETITGVRSRNQPIQGMLIELMANSINHAFPDKKNKEWVLAVNHDVENSSVNFSFVDNGVGILDTLHLTLKQVLKQFFKGDEDLLKTAFEGKIGSRTGLNYRGRGLPSILKKYKNNCFSELVVITNNVFLDFENDKFVQLNSSFKGTYYYWELKSKNIK